MYAGKKWRLKQGCIYDGHDDGGLNM
jgi:hypothetical protein